MLFLGQAEFERLFSDDFLQLLRLTAKIFDFVAGGRMRCVAGKTALAGFEEFL